MTSKRPVYQQTQLQFSSQMNYHGPGDITRETARPRSGQGSMSDYKKLPVKKLDPFCSAFCDRVVGKTTDGEDVPAIFKGVSLYFNGRSAPNSELSSFHLGKIVQRYGGRVQRYVSVKNVTHIICENLCKSKSDFYKSHPQIRVLSSAWITDSVKAGVRLSESKYLWETKGSTKTLKSFFKPKSKVQGIMGKKPAAK